MKPLRRTKSTKQKLQPAQRGVKKLNRYLLMEIITYGDTSILNGVSDYDAANECRRDCGDCRDCRDCHDCGDCRRDCSDCDCDNDNCFNDYDTHHKDDDYYDGCGDCYWENSEEPPCDHCEWDD